MTVSFFGKGCGLIIFFLCHIRQLAWLGHICVWHETFPFLSEGESDTVVSFWTHASISTRSTSPLLLFLSPVQVLKGAT